MSTFWRDLESEVEQIRADGCEHCQGDVEVLEVASDRFGRYASVVCLTGGTERCSERRQKVYV